MVEPSVSLFGPLDTYVAPYIEYILLALLLVNIVARAVEHHRHVQQAEDGGADALSRGPVKVATDFLLVFGAFYYVTLHHHGGVIFSVLVIGLFITDLFEFEARKVEARREIDIERPKAAIAASFLALLYIAYQSVFFIIKPFWTAIV